MKTLTGLTVIGLLASVAQAGLFLSVNGDISQDPVVISIEDIVKLSIVSTDNEPAMIMALLVTEGPALVDTTAAIVTNPLGITHPVVFEDITGWSDDYVTSLGYHPVSTFYLEITDVGIPPLSLPDGPLVTDITLQAMTDDQDIVISLLDDSRIPPALMDAQILHVPEPATIILFGLGVLGPWRRRF